MKRQQTSPMDVNIKRQKSSPSSFQHQKEEEESDGSNNNNVDPDSVTFYHYKMDRVASPFTDWSPSTSRASSSTSSLKPIILDVICGVTTATGIPCTKTLSCKTHTLVEKNLVQGRSADIKTLQMRHMPDREYDEEEHCGVIIDGVGPCTRAFSCPFHTLTQKRAVARLVPYDILLANKKLEREAEKLESITFYQQVEQQVEEQQEHQPFQEQEEQQHEEQHEQKEVLDNNKIYLHFYSNNNDSDQE